MINTLNGAYLSRCFFSVCQCPFMTFVLIVLQCLSNAFLLHLYSFSVLQVLWIALSKCLQSGIVSYVLVCLHYKYCFYAVDSLFLSCSCRRKAKQMMLRHLLNHFSVSAMHDGVYCHVVNFNLFYLFVQLFSKQRYKVNRTWWLVRWLVTVCCLMLFMMPWGTRTCNISHYTFGHQCKTAKSL